MHYIISKFKLLLILSIIIFSNLILVAQNEYSIHREIKWSLDQDSLTWHETIIPNSISWKINDSTAIIPFTISKNIIRINNNSIFNSSDTVKLNFEILPQNFHEHFSVFDSSKIRIEPGDAEFDPYATPSKTSLLSAEDLEYNGALTRGFSVGNNQSLVFDSDLNIQLNGKIGDGYLVTAAITDQNLPIQPDGTTRQLQEFDKVYIQIQKTGILSSQVIMMRCSHRVISCVIIEN